jgi:hypothetical protein
MASEYLGEGAVQDCRRLSLMLLHSHNFLRGSRVFNLIITNDPISQRTSLQLQLT